MRTRRTFAAFAALAALLAAGSLFAQGNPTGKVTGRVTADGEGLPGVLVSFNSPNLQGTRTTTTQGNGEYIAGLLPPGDYTVTFTLEGFHTVEQRIAVPTAQTVTLDVPLALATVREVIDVVGRAEDTAISESSQSSVTYDDELIEDLPVARTIRGAVTLAPGVHATGPQRSNGEQAITISGSQSYENLFLVNGVVVNENLRGQPFDLYIEDAIQETTTSTSGISAEYGRFAGGVVNLITKSGGNELSGSFRTSFQNEDWAEPTPVTTQQNDEVIPTFEATLGGPLLRDRLWFFTAGRTVDEDEAQQTLLTNVPYTQSTEQRRYEAKLTGSITPGHRLLGSLIEEEEDTTNFDPFGLAMELAAVDPSRSEPQSLRALNYTGVVTPSLFVEAQYSEREFSFEGSGGDDPDLIRGTVMYDSQNLGTYHAPWFCGDPCRDEQRNNENWLAKASYFLTTDGFGSHELVAGYDSFEDIRAADNHQSASDFTFFTDTTVIRDGQIFPVANPFNSALVWWPILESTQGTSFKTNSAFVNDVWRVNDRLTLNLGVRYDENDGVDSAGNQRLDDSKVSPRLGLSWDVLGDGEWTVHGSYGTYVTAIANTVGNRQSKAGQPAIIVWLYGGPAINPDPNTPSLIDQDEALRIMFDWFDSIGGTSNLRPFNGVDGWVVQTTIPGAANTVSPDLASPSADEISFGFTKQLGPRGLFRADYVRREFQDLYFRRLDLTTGQVTIDDPLLPPITIDREVVENASDDELERVYDGLHTQLSYRLGDRLNLGGNWTWSHARGNFDGETATSGPVASTAGLFPEYKAFPQHNPRGDLGIDSRHKVRAWASWDAISADRQDLTVSLLQSFISGTPYGALGAVRSSLFVQNPGYEVPPNSVTYYFTNRDAFTTPDITSTDLALNYAFQVAAFGRPIELFVQPEVLNVFDEQEAIVVNASVLDATVAAGYQNFDPFTETPVEGVHWDFGPNFGQPLTENSFQPPRTFRFSVGLRF